jgi:hypothetical protein
MPSRMYSTIQLLEIMRRSAFKSPLSYPFLLGWTAVSLRRTVGRSHNANVVIHSQLQEDGSADNCAQLVDS